MNRLTDIQEIWKYLELVNKHPRNVSKRFQKDISSRTKDIKQFSQLTTHGRTHAHTWVNLEMTPPEGGSAKKLDLKFFILLHKQILPVFSKEYLIAKQLQRTAQAKPKEVEFSWNYIQFCFDHGFGFSLVDDLDN